VALAAEATPSVVEGEVGRPARADPAAEYTAERYAVTVAEATRRATLDPNIDRLAALIVQELAAVSGGIFIDHSQDAFVRVAVADRATPDDLAAADAMIEKAGLSGEAAVVPVRYSYPELVAAYVRLGGGGDGIEPADDPVKLDSFNTRDIVSVGINIPDNAVEVGVLKNGSLASAAAEIGLKVGEIVRVTESDPILSLACPTQNACDAPLRGGTRVSAPQTPGPATTACTGGFVARAPLSGRRYLVTAGHCFANISSTTNFSVTIANGTTSVLGPPLTALYENGCLVVLPTDPCSAGDMGAIRILNYSTTGWDARGWVFNTSVDNSYPIRTVELWGPHAGDSVCAMGITSGKACGTVGATSLCYSVTVGNVFRKYCGVQRVDGLCRTSGDSGGPAFRFNGGYGVLSGATGLALPCNSVYEDLSDIASTITLDFLHCDNASDIVCRT
jgi:Trypsin